MTFASIVLAGVGTVLLWAAIKGENPVEAAADVIDGSDGDELDPADGAFNYSSPIAGIDRAKVRTDVPRSPIS